MQKPKQYTLKFDLPLTKAEVLPMTHLSASNQPRFKDETLAFLATFHETSVVQAIRKTIADCHKTAGTSMPETMMLTGSSGVGKTLALMKYQENYPRTTIDGRKKVPVLYLLVPNGAGEKEVLIGLLEALTEKLNINGTTTTLKKRLIHQLKLAEVELIILDEAQRLHHYSFHHTPLKAVDLLTYLQDSTSTPFVLAGTSKVCDLISPEVLEDGTDDEERMKELEAFIRRARQTINIPAYDVADKKWQGLLDKSFENFPRTINAEKADKLEKRIFIATQGRLGFYNKLLKEVLEITSPNEPVTLTVFSQAFKRITAKPLCGFNPFENMEYVNAYLKDVLKLKEGK